MLKLSGRSWQLATSPGTKVTGHTIFWSFFYPTPISPFIPGRSLVHLCNASLVISASPKEHSPAHGVPPSGWITDKNRVCLCPKHPLCAAGFVTAGAPLGSRALCGGQTQQLPQFFLLHLTATKCNMSCAWKPAGTAMPEILGTPQHGEEG